MGEVVQYTVIFAYDAAQVPLWLVSGLDLWKFDELLKEVTDEQRNNLLTSASLPAVQMEV
jgi:hypothetical protein